MIFMAEMELLLSVILTSALILLVLDIIETKWLKYSKGDRDEDHNTD